MNIDFNVNNSNIFVKNLSFSDEKKRVNFAAQKPFINNDTVQFSHIKSNQTFNGLFEKIKDAFTPTKKENGVTILPTITSEELDRKRNKLFKKQFGEFKKLINKTYCSDQIKEEIFSKVNPDNIEVAILVYKKHSYALSWMPDLLDATNSSNINIAKKAYATMSPNELVHYLSMSTRKTAPYIEQIYTKYPKFNKFLPSIVSCLYKNQDDEDFNSQFVRKVIQLSEKMLVEAKKLPTIKINNEEYKSTKPKEYFNLLEYVSPTNIDIALELSGNHSYDTEDLYSILSHINRSNIDDAKEILKEIAQGEIDQTLYVPLMDKKIDYKKYKLLTKKLGKHTVKKLNSEDILVASKIAYLANVKDTKEIKLSEKRELLKALVKSVHGQFRLSRSLEPYFPLAPKTTKAYCKIMPKLVESLGIQTKKLSDEEIYEFRENLNGLALSLAELSNEEFANLRFTQEFPKDAFIKSILFDLKTLSQSERQKVYDYFGFELHHNFSTQTGYSLIGYPSDSDKKLNSIDDQYTKSVIENIRPYVIKFSNDNYVTANNKQIEVFLNGVLKYLPELHTTIGRKQHGFHDFDIMKHSLKVLQKIVQSADFEVLNESDQKVIMLAALLHDITKAESAKDTTHADNGSFDAFYISKKFNLSNDESIKLYKLIKHHEWLAYVNTSKSKGHWEKRMQSVAFDLQQDNLFSMALTFTHADLLAVKADDSLHEMINQQFKVNIDGIKRTFGESADFYSYKINEYIDKLKTTQPLLPVTKFPPADIIRKNVNKIYSDGSTNIKGVYIDKNGLVIVKYNEVEKWEDLGFSSGTISKGISTIDKTRYKRHSKTYDTGNIKFFVHGLDYENQLAKFDAFALPDSNALLSVSYAERPESKYRFFRPQGVILDVDTNYIYGGGKSDSGSGYAKTIHNFKHDYIFGGEKEYQREYISKSLKKTFGMNDDEYTLFVKKNKNKSMLEIEPEEIRNKLIQELASMTSRERSYSREYNEMFVSNPKVMGVFAYICDFESSQIHHPIEYIKDNFEFLKQYAIDKNIPFVIFGD